MKKLLIALLMLALAATVAACSSDESDTTTAATTTAAVTTTASASTTTTAETPDEETSTAAPETTAATPETEAPETGAPETEAPETEAPETEAPETEAPETEAPETEAPETEAPETEAPVTEAPVTEAPVTTTAPETEEPDAPVVEPSQIEWADNNASVYYELTENADGTLHVSYTKETYADAEANYGYAGYSWVNMAGSVEGIYNGQSKFVITVKGTSGQTLLIKPFDNQALEQTITFDGSEQTFEFDLSTMGQPTSMYIILMGAGGSTDVSGEFDIISALFE